MFLGIKAHSIRLAIGSKRRPPTGNFLNIICFCLFLMFILLSKELMIKTGDFKMESVSDFYCTD